MPVPLPSSRTVLLLAGLVLGSGFAPLSSGQSGNGLKLPAQSWGEAQQAGEAGGAAWRGRIGLGFSTGSHPRLTPNLQEAAAIGADAAQVDSVRLLGDYYFSRNSGFRATGGVLRGSIGAPWMLTGTGTVGLSRQGGSGLGLQSVSLDAAISTVPYLGAGYSFDLPQTLGGDWSFSADVGMVAVSPGVRLGRGYGSQYLDDAVRELRLRPVLQLGVSYSF